MQKFQSDDAPPAGETPFFYFVTLAMVFIAGWSIYSTPKLHSPGYLVLFIILMALHIALYWAAFALPKVRHAIPLYLGVQGILALLINLVGDNLALPLGLFMGLIGITVGFYGLTRNAFLFICAYLFLALYSFSKIVGWGDSIWWLLGTVPIMVFVVLYVTLYNRQSEARVKAQSLAADLELANRRLTEYAARVETLTLAAERQRMARELHDTLSQGLAGVILQLEAADAHLASGRGERAQQIVKQTMTQARATLAGARRAIDDLRQSPTGLRDVIQQEAQRFTQITGIPCHVDITQNDQIPPDVIEASHRAVSEALTNIARHAKAHQVRILVGGSDDSTLEITVEDDGVGFDPETAVGKPGHYGLLGIRERARLAGGVFTVASFPGQGTKLTLRLPLTQPAYPETGQP